MSYAMGVNRMLDNDLEKTLQLREYEFLNEFFKLKV